MEELCVNGTEVNMKDIHGADACDGVMIRCAEDGEDMTSHVMSDVMSHVVSHVITAAACSRRYCIGYWLTEKKAKRLNFEVFRKLCRFVIYS